jgi:hypothetical protein
MPETRHLSRAELESGLDHVRASPADEGVLRLIVRRPAVGARDALDEGRLDPAEGLVGDTWSARRGSRTRDRAPHPDTQITIMNARAIALICPDPARWPLAGDQLFVEMDLGAANLPPGTRLSLGGALLEVARQPHTGCGKFVERFGLDAMKLVNSLAGRTLNLRGIYARVIAGGTVRVGDVARTVRAAAGGLHAPEASAPGPPY